MKRFVSITACGLLLGLVCVAGIDISLEIEEIRSDTGEILISLFASGDGFPGDHKQAVQLSSVKASTNGVSVVFTNVVPGAYAVSVCHDENSDGQMNRKFYGPPKEGYGLYRKEKPRMGPPQFQDSVFDVGTSNLSLTVSLLYPED